jgi:Capsular polysaccharide synthesis protein
VADQPFSSGGTSARGRASLSSEKSAGDVTVWMYWEDAPGRTCPAYIQLCRETIRRHLGPSMSLAVLDQTTVFDWLPDLDRGIWKRLVVPAQRADYIRTRLTYRYGGLWIDADCIAIQGLDRIVELLADDDVVTWGGDVQGRFFNNLFAARAGASLVERWIEQQDEALASADDLSRLPWAAIGSDSLYPILQEVRYANLPADKVAPVLWLSWRKFFSPFQSPADVLAPDPYTVMLWNKGMGPLLAKRSVDDVLTSKMLLSRLLRIALGRSTLHEELDLYTRFSRFSDIRYRPRVQGLERRARSLAADTRKKTRGRIGPEEP